MEQEPTVQNQSHPNKLSVTLTDQAASLIAWWSASIMGLLGIAEYSVGLRSVPIISGGGFLLIVLTRLTIWELHPYLGKVVFTLLANLTIFLAEDIAGTGPAWYLYYLPAMSLPLLMWEHNRTKTIAAFICIPVIFKFLGTYLGRGFFMPQEDMPLEKYFEFVSFFMSGAMLTFFMYYYVTEARKAYQLLAEQQIISINSSKLAALGEMAGGIAHEINNPLAIISGYMQQLRKILSDFPHMAEKTEKQLSKIESMVTRISRIVLGLRSFARDGSADPVERFSLQSLVEESLILAETKLKTMGVSLKQIMPSEVIWLDGQKVQLSQVLVNLINNAFDAIEPNQEKWISIQAQIIGQRLELSVTDSGHGIPLKVQEKLMQPFYTTKPLGKGTGLGLSISKGIVERHKGRFYYDSKCQNTRFVLDLPIAATSRSSVAA